MTIYVAAKADSKRVATELLTHENLSLEARVSTDSEKIETFVKTQNTDPKLQSCTWTMFQIEVPESSIVQMIGS